MGVNILGISQPKEVLAPILFSLLNCTDVTLTTRFSLIDDHSPSPLPRALSLTFGSVSQGVGQLWWYITYCVLRPSAFRAATNFLHTVQSLANSRLMVPHLWPRSFISASTILHHVVIDHSSLPPSLQASAVVVVVAYCSQTRIIAEGATNHSSPAPPPLFVVVSV